MPYRDPEKRRAASREATRRWYQRNRERVRAAKRVKDRERYAARRENVLSAKRERFANDPVFAERLRAENRSWYARNRERRRESNRRYREINGEALRARERVRNRRKYERDPRAVLDYYKRWRERNLAKARAYVRAASIKRRAASQGHTSAPLNGLPWSSVMLDVALTAVSCLIDSKPIIALRSVPAVRISSTTSCPHACLATGESIGKRRMSSARF
jgi:hypothetical protein